MSGKKNAAELKKMLPARGESCGYTNLWRALTPVQSSLPSTRTSVATPYETVKRKSKIATDRIGRMMLLKVTPIIMDAIVIDTRIT